MRTFDFSYLNKVVSNEELQAFRTSPEYNEISTSLHVSPGLSLFFGGMLGVWVAAMLGAFDITTVPVRLVVIAIMVAIGSIVGYKISIRYARYVDESKLRLSQFAAQNELQYETNITTIDHTGLIFDQGNERSIGERFLDKQSDRYEIGNFEYTTGTGKNRTTVRIGYVCIYLERNVPHMVLDSKRNNLSVFGLNISTLPKGFDKNQTLMLEGDFNNHFTLYAPQAYERDALYIFTPDLMALLIDESAQFDVETVDNRLYIYSVVPFSFKDQTTFETIFSIIDVLGAKAVARTDRYVDQRRDASVNYEIAEQGRRLKHGQAPEVIIIGVIFGIIVLLQVAPLIIALFTS